MKKFMFTIMAFTAIIAFTSCSDSNDSLSSSTAKSLVKDELKRQHELVGAFSIRVGYFECNDDVTRYQYKQLAANELITYKCDIVKKKVRVQKERKLTDTNWWGEKYEYTDYYWTDEEVKTYFMTVTLTEKGKKLIYVEEPAELSDDEKDLKPDMVFDRSKFPESNVPLDSDMDSTLIAKKKPQLPTMSTAITEEVYDTVAADTAEAYGDVDMPEPDSSSKKEAKAKNAYEEAKAKEFFEEVKLKGYEIKIIKARNILKTGDYSAHAEIIAELDEVTPVGRIFGNLDEGRRFLLGTCNYIYYQDKGWQFDNIQEESEKDYRTPDSEE